MKRLLPLLFLGTAIGQAAEDSEIPLGIEVVTGYRSEYLYRGFSLADQMIDIQIDAEIALSNEWILSLGGSYGDETSSGNFSEAAAYLGLIYEQEKWDAGLDASWHSYDHSFFQDGFDLGPFANWRPCADWRVGAAFSYDTGADGWYGKLEAEWTRPTGRSSFVSVLGGLSAVSTYYHRSGANDFYARLAWTYGINRSVAITPFLGTSLPLTSKGDSSLFAGLWFEVNF